MWPELKFPALNLWNAPLSPEMIKLHMELMNAPQRPIKGQEGLRRLKGGKTTPLYIAALLLPLIAGCSGDAVVRGDLVKGNVEIAKEQAKVSSLPLVELSQPMCYPYFIPNSTGDMVFQGMKCSSQTLLVRNPNGGTAPQQVATPRDTQAELGLAAINNAGTAINFALGGWAAKELTESATKGVINGINSATTPNTTTINSSFNSTLGEE